MAALLAALSALSFGVGDFFGGLSARRIVAQVTTVTAQATGLVLVVGASAFVGGSPSGGDLVIGAAAGVAGAIGLVLFYWSMSKGPMSVVAPISAVMSALVPVRAGVLDGERPAPLAVAGILLALPAIVLISREPSSAEAATSEAVVEASVHVHVPPRVAAFGGLPVVAAALGGIGFGLFFTILSHSSDDSGLWPIASARSAAVLLTLTAIVFTRPGAPDPRGVGLAVAAGCLDVTGNAFYLFASRQGLLTLVGVIGAMYPASTVVLARAVLGERLARHQLAGLAVAAVAVVAIAIA